LIYASIIIRLEFPPLSFKFFFFFPSWREKLLHLFT
jgi:hypothetical protein